MKRYSRILVIPDQHFPYNHIDIFKFLSAIKKRFKPDKVVNVGDEVDCHSFSMHDHDPDLPSPRDEMGHAMWDRLGLYLNEELAKHEESLNEQYAIIFSENENLD